MGYHLRLLSYLANLADDLPLAGVLCDRARQQVPRLLEHSLLRSVWFRAAPGSEPVTVQEAVQALIGWRLVGKICWERPVHLACGAITGGTAVSQTKKIQGAWMYSLHRALER